MREPLIGIIPARWASSRFPGKPLAMIHGQTMMARVVQRALAAEVFDDVLVATDHRDIAREAKRAGAAAIMTDSEIPNGTLRCHAALVQWEAETGKTARAILNIQGDEPFVDAESLRDLAQLIDLPGAAVATLGHNTRDARLIADPNRVKVVTDLKGKALYFSRMPIPAGEDGAILHHGLYAFTRGAFEAITLLHPTPLEKRESLEQLRWLEHGWRVQVGLTTSPSPSVDTPQDIENIEKLIALGALVP